MGITDEALKQILARQRTMPVKTTFLESQALAQELHDARAALRLCETVILADRNPLHHRHKTGLCSECKALAAAQAQLPATTSTSTEGTVR